LIVPESCAGSGSGKTARPGANLTGVTGEDVELSPKRLELLRALVPGLKRVLFAYDEGNTASTFELKAYREAARTLGIELVERNLRTQADAQRTFVQLRKADAQAARAINLSISRDLIPRIDRVLE